MIMKYVIVNECDRPHGRLVAQVIDGKAYYMQRHVEDYMKQYDGMDISRSTNVEDFGFEIIEDVSLVRFRFIGDGIAKYRDGSPREWQGEIYFTHVPVRLEA